MRPRWVWVGLAAAVVVVAAAVVVVPRIGRGPVPTPSSGQPTLMRPATPGFTPSRLPTLTWVRRANAPMDASDHLQVSASGGDYFLKASGACGRVVGYRHDLATDVWHAIRPGPVPSRGTCYGDSAFAHGAEIYVPGREDPPDSGMTMSVYHTATQSWTVGPRVAMDACALVGLTTGILCSRRGEETLPLRYSFFDYETARWQDGSVDLGVANTGERVEPVTVDGRSLALVTVWPDFTRDGTMTLVTFDPATGKRVLSMSKELSRDTLQTIQGNAQAAEPGYVFIGPGSPAASAGEADLLDLRTGVWTTLRLPVQGANPTSAADWVADYFGAETAGYVVANGYLYHPATQRWFAVPWDGVPPPELESESQEVMTRAGPRQRCEWAGDHECWALGIGSLEEISRELDATELPTPR